jgi:hypothetical protein
VDEVAQTWTREELEELRGGFEGNGAADLAVPVPNGKHADEHVEPVGECLHCSAPLYRHDQKYCGPSCRSRYRRSHPGPALVSPQEPMEVRAVGETVSSSPEMQLVAQLVGLGATLSFTVAGVAVSALAPPNPYSQEDQ